MTQVDVSTGIELLGLLGLLAVQQGGVKVSQRFFVTAWFPASLLLPLALAGKGGDRHTEVPASPNRGV